MIVENGICYADNRSPCLNVIDACLVDGHTLDVQFNSGETKRVDFTELFQTPAFTSLKNDKVFSHFRIEFGTITWENGSIDVAPEYLLEKGIPLPAM